MTCKIMTDNGATLDRRAMDKLRALLAALESVADDQRHFLAAVASMHPFEGDPLGAQAAALRVLLEAVQAQARELQALVPAPYVSPPPYVYTEPLPRPAQPVK